jgi:hypothetical protein
MLYAVILILHYSQKIKMVAATIWDHSSIYTVNDGGNRGRGGIRKSRMKNFKDIHNLCAIKILAQDISLQAYQAETHFDR